MRKIFTSSRILSNINPKFNRRNSTFNMGIHLKYNARHIGNDESFEENVFVSWQAWLASTVAKHVDQNSSEISCNEGTEKKRKSQERSHGTRNYRSIISIVSSLLSRDRYFFSRIFMLFFTFSRSFFLSPPPSFSSFRNRLDSHLLLLLSIAT